MIERPLRSIHEPRSVAGVSNRGAAPEPPFGKMCGTTAHILRSPLTRLAVLRAAIARASAQFPMFDVAEVASRTRSADELEAEPPPLLGCRSILVLRQDAVGLRRTEGIAARLASFFRWASTSLKGWNEGHRTT